MLVVLESQTNTDCDHCIRCIRRVENGSLRHHSHSHRIPLSQRPFRQRPFQTILTFCFEFPPQSERIRLHLLAHFAGDAATDSGQKPSINTSSVGVADAVVVTDGVAAYIWVVQILASFWDTTSRCEQVGRTQQCSKRREWGCHPRFVCCNGHAVSGRHLGEDIFNILKMVSNWKWNDVEIG